MKTIYIYGLHAPGDCTIMYVGRTSNLALRVQQHVWEARLGKVNVPRNDWIRHLLAKKQNPIAVILESCNQEHAAEREYHWINRYRALNPGLKNYHWWSDADNGRAYVDAMGGIEAVRAKHASNPTGRGLP